MSELLAPYLSPYTLPAAVLNTAFWASCAVGTIETATQLLAAGADVNAWGPFSND